MLPLVTIVATGGTIANMPDGRVAIEHVLEDIRVRHPSEDPGALARIEVLDVLRADAATFTPNEWLVIGRAVERALADAAAASVVVTHGTFTVEETAYFLNLTVRGRAPVVLTCSQRKHATLGNDGDRNLLDAFRVALAPEARGKGVLVVVNEEIHAARDVVKTNQRPSGFVSRGSGILGSVEADRVSFYRAPTRRHTSASEFTLTQELPRVDVVATYAGADGVAVRAFIEAGARGLVVNGFAYSGKPHPSQTPALREAVERGVAVVLVNRGGGGRIPVVGDDPFVRGDDLTAQKARILLAVALTRTSEPAELQRVFDEY